MEKKARKTRRKPGCDSAGYQAHVAKKYTADEVGASAICSRLGLEIDATAADLLAENRSKAKELKEWVWEKARPRGISLERLYQKVLEAEKRKDYGSVI